MKIKLAIAAILAFASVSAVQAEDLKLVQDGTLMVATEGTYPPFSMQSPSGELDGLEIRVMKEISSRIGLTYEPVVTKWDSLLVGLSANQYDVISAAMDITEERQKAVLFSDGWLESGGRIVTMEDSAIKSAADLKGKAVGALVAPRTVVPGRHAPCGLGRVARAITVWLDESARGNTKTIGASPVWRPPKPVTRTCWPPAGNTVWSRS